MGSRWSASKAEAVLNAWRESGLSVKRFAQERGLKAKRIYRWRSRLDGKPMRRGKRGKAAPSLLPVVVSATKAAEAPITVTLRNGRELKVGCGFDEGTFSRLVQLLEGT